MADIINRLEISMTDFKRIIKKKLIKVRKVYIYLYYLYSQDVGPALYKCYTYVLCILGCDSANLSEFSIPLDLSPNRGSIRI